MKPDRFPDKFGDPTPARQGNLERSAAGNGQMWQMVGSLQLAPECRIEAGEQSIVDCDQTRLAGLKPFRDDTLCLYGILGRKGLNSGKVKAREKRRTRDDE